MRNSADKYHAFPEMVRDFADYGKITNQLTTKGEKITLNIPGSINGKEGVYRFVKTDEGKIIHRCFWAYK